MGATKSMQNDYFSMGFQNFTSTQSQDMWKSTNTIVIVRKFVGNQEFIEFLTPQTQFSFSLGFTTPCMKNSAFYYAQSVLHVLICII